MSTQATTEKCIVVVGGGIIGCCSAYYITRHPSFDRRRHRVILLESSTIAGGSSGKAGGLVAKWAFPRQLSHLSFDLHRALAEEHDGPRNWGYRAVTCGEVTADGRRAHTPAAAEPSTGRGKRKHGLPPDLDWLDPDCVTGYGEIGDDESTAQVDEVPRRSWRDAPLTGPGPPVSIHKDDSRAGRAGGGGNQARHGSRRRDARRPRPQGRDQSQIQRQRAAAFGRANVRRHGRRHLRRTLDAEIVRGGADLDLQGPQYHDPAPATVESARGLYDHPSPSGFPFAHGRIPRIVDLDLDLDLDPQTGSRIGILQR